MKNIYSLLNFTSLVATLFATFLCGSFALAAPDKQLSQLNQSIAESLARLPIQNGGRLKPLDSFAQDALLFISERRYVHLTEAEREDLLVMPSSPLGTALSWLANPEKWATKKFIPFDHIPAKEAVGLDTKSKYFSPIEIMQAPQMQERLSAMNRKEQSGAKLDQTEQAIGRAISRAELFQSIASGNAWTIVPPLPSKALDQTGEGAAQNRNLPSGHPATDGAEHPAGGNDHWLSITAPEAQASGIPQTLVKLLKFTQGDSNTASNPSLNTTPLNDAGVYQSVIADLATRQGYLLVKHTKLLELATAMNREVLYNHLRPFQKSWFIYFAAFLCFLISLPAALKKAKFPLRVTGWILFITGFALHCYGFALRCLLTGRPPVTNMYESTVWVPWGVVLFSFFIAAMYRKQEKMVIIPLAATAVATLALILSDSVPAVLDPTIRPLEPVLRSNYWLTIHVLTITLSYAAFALSLGLGDIVLGFYTWRPRAQDSIRLYTQFMYRAVQFGVVLLAAGTILGGVWADYSWGRFWGWDPKETWALTALLMYVAVLHGKWAGWLKQFGIVVGTVCCFLGVLMAWYGVNFVLGVGLHSYGFSSGGLEFIGVFICVQILFVALVVLRHRTRLT